MRTKLTVTVVAVMVFLITIPALAQGVYNINLTPVGNSGISGKATTIIGNVAGSNPYQNVEVNMMMNQPATAGNVYEAWLIDSDNNYKLSLGTFNGTRLSFRQNMINVSSTAPFDSIAVSLKAATCPNPANVGVIVAQGSLPGTAVSAADFQSMAVLPLDDAYQRQLLTQCTGLTNAQIMALRMQGWSYSDISTAATAATNCNRNINDVVVMMQQGQTWDQIASTCNMTASALLAPVPCTVVTGPVVAAPGTIGAVGTGASVCTPECAALSPLTGYGFNRFGTPAVTQFTWRQLYNRGYSWRDVAVAANISAQTGEDVEDLLRMTRVSGQTWATMITDRGLDRDDMLDVSAWPFGDRPGVCPPGTPGTVGAGGTMVPTCPPGTLVNPNTPNNQ